MTQNGAATCQQSGTQLTRENLDLFLTLSSLRGIQRRTKDRVKQERIGTLLKQLEQLPTSFGDHRTRLDRYIAHQLQLLGA